MNNRNWMLAFIFVVIMTAAFIVYKFPTKLGLDLVGGSRLVLEAQTTDTIAKITPEMMNSLQFAIEKRINSLGVAETVVQRNGEKRLLVEIPNITDPAKAKEYLGDTAELEFKELKSDSKDPQGEWVSTGLTGKDLNKAQVTSNPTTGEWVVSLEFNDAGAQKFAKLTSRLVGKPMAIFFNGELQSAPVIREPITGGMAQISGGDNGGFKADEAQKMVDLLNAGALPVPAKIIEENSVGPTLGADSIAKSKMAGIVGLGLVVAFMFLIYGIPGLVANIALGVYALIVLALFKIIPVTLTLAGIAGFVLSIGMAVDANILIFERTKEELRSGKRIYTAINTGFDRAFTSIFDSNMTTILTCMVLYFLGTSIVRGFALTLAIGVAVSMFTAITVTRSFMHLILELETFRHHKLFGVNPDEIEEAAKQPDTAGKKAKLGVLD
ncbi:MAG: protein translocase subunit SecD [Eubacteriales bacterium]|nr:protein translocase subunit SecD [Eubacteriales bacterium]